MGILDAYFPDLDSIGLVVFIACVSVTIVARGYAERDRTRKVAGPDIEKAERFRKLFVHKLRLAEATQNLSGKAVREAYRRNWIEHMLNNKQYAEMREIIRNNLMSSAAMISALVVVLGFIISQYGSIKATAFVTNPELKVFTVAAVLFYALYMMITQIRMLMYLPIMSWVDEEVIEAIEGTDKVTYISRMVEVSYDHFSNSMRAIFYSVCCALWFVDPALFIASTLVLSALNIKDDFEQRKPVR
ncbi:MAG: DUF599 family protein [Candidatus Micrarchaeia archaeon]